MPSRCGCSGPFPGSRKPSSPGSAASTATPSSTRRSCSTATLRLKTAPHIRFAGQITGCEGYVESAAIGLLAGRFAAAELQRRDARAAAADDGAGRPARPHHRRRRRRDLPADERQFRPVPAGRGQGEEGGPQSAPIRSGPRRRWRSGSPTASPCEAMGRGTSEAGGGVASARSASDDRRDHRTRRPSSRRRHRSAAPRSPCSRIHASRREIALRIVSHADDCRHRLPRRACAAGQ